MPQLVACGIHPHHCFAAHVLLLLLLPQGRMQGPDVGELLAALSQESGSDVVDRALLVDLPTRMAKLQQWAEAARQ